MIAEILRRVLKSNQILDMKVQEESEVASSTYDASSGASTALISSIKSMMDTCKPGSEKKIGELSSATTTQMLQLKKSQRQLGLLVGSDISAQLNLKRRQVENEALLLQNILYEKNHLENEIRSCMQVDSTFLLKMAKDELEVASDEINEEYKTRDATEEMNQDEIIDKFLAPSKAARKDRIPTYSHHDTARHSANLSKLHQELSTRGSLHTQLLKAKKEKSQLLQELNKKRKFLASVPKQIEQLEKGMDVIQKHFQDFNHPETSLSLTTDERDEVAGNLCGPLYTLYVQLKTFIHANKDSPLYSGWSVIIKDIENDIRMEIDTENEKLAAIYKKLVRKNEKCIQLQIPIKNGSKDEMLKVEFEYYSELNFVTARVVQDKASELLWSSKSKTSKTVGSLLLQDLIQNDNGQDLPTGSAEKIILKIDTESNAHSLSGVIETRIVEIEEDGIDFDMEEENEEVPSLSQMALWKLRQSFFTSADIGRPYNWCQYVAGLNFTSKHLGESLENKEMMTQSQTEASMKTMMQLIQRRVRSHTVLRQHLKSFGNGVVNCHPSVDPSDFKTKILNFSEIANDDKSVIYALTLKCNTKTLKCQVKIDSGYPIQPPTWSLQEATTLVPSSRGDSNLYDSTLGNIEARVNSLEGGNGIYYNQEVEESFDWILSHQMRQIMLEWDLMLSSTDGVAVKNSPANDMRGRDRCPSSLYELYKHGL